MQNVAKWFHKQKTWIQVLLLFLPIINWACEICIRWTTFFKRGTSLHLVVAIVAIPGGLLLGWADVVSFLFTRQLLFGKNA